MENTNQLQQFDSSSQSSLNSDNINCAAYRRPPSHATHIGSLLRPLQLLSKRTEFRSGKCSARELEEVEDEAIRSNVEMQRLVGIKDITDGECRRSFFYDGVFEKLEGMTFIPEAPVSEMEQYVPFVPKFLAEGINKWPSYFCSSKIRRPSEGLYVSQFKFLKSILSPDELRYAKITMCPPEWMHLRYGSRTYDHSVYKNDDEYFSDLTKVYREEIRELYELGCRNIQIDSPTFCFFLDSTMEHGLNSKNSSVEALLSQYIKVINDCFRDVRHPNKSSIGIDMSDMTVGIHICRGNFRGQHFVEGGYDKIAMTFLTELDVDCFYMEFDSPRAGTLEPLKCLPKDKIVVLGLISTKIAELEDPEDIKKRIYEAAEWICKGNPGRTMEEALSQLRLSPQCGFASFSVANISEEYQRKKLSLVVKIANEIWGRKIDISFLYSESPPLD